MITSTIRKYKLPKIPPDHQFFSSIVQPWEDFNKTIQSARTPPSSWYTDPQIAQIEKKKIFWKNWIPVAYQYQLPEAGSYITNYLCQAPYILCRNENQNINAFHNVCRHHGSEVARNSGTLFKFECPYHGWTYNLDGQLVKATKLKGIENFKAKENGLFPIQSCQWGPLFFLNFSQDEEDVKGRKSLNEWLGEGGKHILESGVHDDVRHVARVEYHVNCNWKVYCDNYLDGGYHIEYAHKDLAKSIDPTSYKSTIFETASVQTCIGKSERVASGRMPMYAFIYPNLMINRYGPWMDINIVFPKTIDSCVVVYDYFLKSCKQLDEDTIRNQLKESNVVALEDKEICESVQRGLMSPAYTTGWYAPQETPMFHFHQLLYKDYMQETQF
eukprot:TRINITY_DN6294_c0_g1_i2.p1 TRINITY_DN6294_c0_g1~~TRINITY_DN6294_c0_g1_i2.p1  ORF type:complete len:397 (+),score=11.91 TRINITY_DN6294_c0_g1_i2:35-1192(+)